MQAYFGWAKPCSCSLRCCSRHLSFYDSGRLGRVEIVTLAVGAREKGERGRGEKKYLSSLPAPLPAPFDSPHFLLSSGSFNMTLSWANCALKENACTAGYHSLEQKENRHGIQTLSKGFSFSLLLLHIKKYTKISRLKKNSKFEIVLKLS